jgi:hypothetical protein
MKNIILILTIIATLSCKAQSPIISMVDYENDDDIELTENCYLKDVENKLLPFVGTWQWTNGTNTFTVVIERLEMVFEPHTNTYSDYLIGKYKYVENGIEIINNLSNNINATNMWTGADVPISNAGYDSDTESRLLFIDYIKQKRCNVKFELTEYLTDLNGNISATKAQWNLYDKERTVINGENQTPVGFSVPTDVELIKQ